MAELSLLPRKAFSIKLEDGSIINGQYGTWAMYRFCTKRNFTLEQAGEAFTNNPNIIDIIEYILSAVEQSFRQLKIEGAFPYTDVDCGSWIDELGGVLSPTSDLWKLFRHSADGSADEKKSDFPPPANS